MIITRTPFRVSFCGGGSDLPQFYIKHGGCVLSAGINKYMYIMVHPSFAENTIMLKYSQTEIVNDVNEVQHKYYRSILSKLDVNGVEIVSTADVPAGTGLGSSSSFTVGVLHALYAYKGKYVSKEKLAEQACNIEIVDLMEPIGKQDQYAAAYGGLNFITFNKDGSVFVEPVIMPGRKRDELEKNLLLFYTGDTRSASNILREQSEKIKNADAEDKQKRICTLAHELRKELEKGNIDFLGQVLHESWMLKRTLAEGISNSSIDEAYEIALKNGATGGKLLGAGGGGFLLFYVPHDKQPDVRKAIKMREMEIGFDKQGSSVIYIGDQP